ncbi:MAG TPA: hypothetical protein VFY69_03385 [Solirubrobacterales bacterium]|nr:hypothetical protein [Solirubrobacterales bacterium]
MACSLQPDEWVERKKLINRIASSGVEEVNLGEEVLTFTFPADPGLRASLEELIRLENVCCPFFEFDLAEHEGSLTLAVQAPNGPATALNALRDMLASPAVVKKSR